MESTPKQTSTSTSTSVANMDFEEVQAPKISEVKPQKTVTREWILKDWQTQHEKIVDMCEISIRGEFCDEVIDEVFFSLVPPSPAGTVSAQTQATQQYISLQMDLYCERTEGDWYHAFYVSVESNVNGATNLKDHYVSFKDTNAGQILVENFLPYKPSQQENELRFKFSVTPLRFSEIEDSATTIETTTSEKLAKLPTPLSANLGAMYLSEDNLSDLNLEMKDGVVLSAHRFILSARSSILGEIIKAELKQPGFNGIIKIDNSGKVMRDLVEWMYTDIFPVTNESVRRLPQILEAADHLNLSISAAEIKDSVDQGLIKICTKDNMFQLYDVAKQNNLGLAAKDIAEFIKSNI